KAGWEATTDGKRTACNPAEGAVGWCFEAVSESPEDRIYLSSHKARHTFDSGRGFVTKSESATTQGYGFNGKGTGTTELLAVKALDADTLKQLAADAERCFAALEAYETATEAAAKATPDKVEALLAKAVSDLKAATEAVRQTDLKAE